MKMTLENKKLAAGTTLILLLGGLLGFVNQKAAIDKDDEGFVLYAHFIKADGLMNGADVRVAGIKVGRLVEQTLSNGYQVRAKMAFSKPIELSTDSSVVIETDGLLGGKYLELMPGGDEEILASGDELAYSQDALILTDLLDKVNAYMREKKGVAPESATTSVETPEGGAENVPTEPVVETVTPVVEAPVAENEPIEIFPNLVSEPVTAVEPETTELAVEGIIE